MAVTVDYNTFINAKKDFKSDTEIEADSNIELYIKWYHAKSINLLMQHASNIYQELDLIRIDLKSK